MEYVVLSQKYTTCKSAVLAIEASLKLPSNNDFKYSYSKVTLHGFYGKGERNIEEYSVF